MKRLLFCILAFIAIGLCLDPATAQLENYPPPKEKLRQHKLLQTFHRKKIPLRVNYGTETINPALAQALQTALDSGRVLTGFKGVSAAMLIPGQGLWSGTSGYSVPATHDSVTSDMIFGIASNTKTFVATILLKLQEQGILSIDDPIHRWLPTYRRDQYKYIDSTITIRQLLNHTSGICNYPYMDLINVMRSDPTRFWEPESILTKYIGPPIFSPGSNYSYCNTNYLLSGMIIKAATGTNLSTQLHQKLLTPLHLDTTFLAVEDSLIFPRAHPWGTWTWNNNDTDFYAFPLMGMFSPILSPGGMFSNPKNMVRWVSNLYGGNVLQDSSLEQMLTFTGQSGGIYGLGVWRNDLWGRVLIGHSGRWVGYDSEMLFDLESGLCVAITENCNLEQYITPFLLNAYILHGAPVYGVSMNKKSFTPTTDTLFANCHLRNPYAHPFSIKGYYLLGDIIRDSSIFYDDGFHHDSLPGDGLWGTQWVIPPETTMYSLTVTPYDSVADYSFSLIKVVNFTAGNLMSIDSLLITRISPSWIKAQVWIRNKGQSVTVPSVHALIKTTDPNIKEFNYSDYDYGDMPPAHRSATPGVFTFKVDASLQTADLQLSLDITTNDIQYWTLNFVAPLRITPTLSRSNIDFGTLGIGETKLDSVILRNPNSLNLHVVSASSNMPGEYSIIPSSAVIAPLDSQKFYVTFNPTTIGVHAGHLIFSYEGTGSPVQMNITGTFSPPSTQFAVNTGWNMVSIPMQPFSYLKSTLFSTTVSPAYTYDNAYKRRDTLAIGVGYWVKYTAPEIAEIPGVAIFSDTFDVNAGWNMIGSISEPIKVTNIGSIPAGIITSGFYFYAGDDHYDVVDTIKPGYGYWVKVSRSGSLILSSSTVIASKNRIRILESSELPPPPPSDELAENIKPIPTRFELLQNYPNPFNPTTEIWFTIHDTRFTSLKIYNVLGREVATLVSEVKQPGEYSVIWDASKLPSGVYFYRMQAGSFVQVKKLLLLK